MKMRIFIIALLGFLVSFGGSVVARPWTDFIGKDVVNPKNYDRISELYDVKQAPFRKLLTQWENKEYQIKQIELLTKNGITKKIAERAIAERLKLAREVVKSNFKGVEDISPTLDRLENRLHVLKKISDLGHERLQSLMKAQGIKVKKGFYSCLCNYYSSAGNGIGYSPPRDKHCDNTNPCKGGNWGCASYDLPKNPERYAYCAKKHKTGKGVNIFQAVTQNFNSGKKLSLKKYKGQEKDCLSTIFSNNPHDIGGLHPGAIAKQALDIARKSKNLCEEAVAVNLFLNSKRGNSGASLSLIILSTWILPNNYDIAGYVSKKKLAESLLKNVLGKAFSAASTLKNIYDSKEIYKKEKGKTRTDVYYDEALELFKESKGWSGSKLNSKIYKIDQEIHELRMDVIRSEEDLTDGINVAGMTIKMENGGPQVSLDKNINPVLHVLFKSQRDKLIADAKSKNIRRLHRIEDLMIKENVLVKYRKPFSEKGCKKYIEDMGRFCQIEIARKRNKQRLGLEKSWQSALESAARTRERLSVGEKNTLSGGVGGHVPGTEPKR